MNTGNTMTLSNEILTLLSRVPLIDVHSDYAIQLYREHIDGNTGAFSKRLSLLRESRVSMEVLTVGGDFDIDLLPLWEYDLVQRIMNVLLVNISRHEMECSLLLTAEDMRAMHERGRIGILLALEGVRCLGDSPELLQILYRLGLRSVILTHNHRNLAADGCSEPWPGGLSVAGRRMLAELRRLRMALDLVHLSPASFRDALDHWDAPPLVSHSNARALCPHPRNLDDEQIRAIGDRGGVIGLNFLALFIDEDRGRADLDRLADHAIHIANIAGPGALALGPDFADYYMDAMQRWIQRDGLPPDLMTFVRDAEDVRGMPAFLDTLLRRGFSLDDIEGIAGRNALRVFEQCLSEKE
jgi:membrane dipeptidase